jgi:hypothetical protein
MSLRFFCCDERRRGAIDGDTVLNGIDFLEVFDDDSMPLNERQKTLFVHFINDPSGLAIGQKNVKILGGEREDYTNPAVVDAQIKVDARSGSSLPVLVVELKQFGDYSRYTLSLVPETSAPNVLDNVDPVLRSVDFSFKANCNSDFDCLEEKLCPPEKIDSPPIDYLTKDYSSFRQLMLDRMALLAPTWKSRNVADYGVALVELLAYVADYLSYQQDAVATEAYLETARQRISVGRHARLVDYRMHNGSNARCWMHVHVNQDTTIAKNTQFLVSTKGLDEIVTPDSKDYHDAINSGTEVFEAVTNMELKAELNSLSFYTWGNRNCCLPKGATKATIRGRVTSLTPGMILVFEEQYSPNTGKQEDADILHRHAVYLTKVTLNDPITGAPLVDPIGGKLENSGNNPINVTEIEWTVEDALPFPVCVSSETDEKDKARYIENITRVIGNLVLIDHGRSIKNEYLGEIPEPHLQRVMHEQNRPSDSKHAAHHCERDEIITVPGRFKFSLQRSPLAHYMPFNESNPPQSAYAHRFWDAAETMPDISLNEGEGKVDEWIPQYDLINSDQNKEFVVEVESDNQVYLRFGNGEQGRRPDPGTQLYANYRIGNGIRGNVGVHTIKHIVTSDSKIDYAINPIPAFGGKEMESITHVRENAPKAFRDLQRAVTPADYETITNRRVDVQKSVASLRWTGSWHTMFVSVDRIGGQKVDQSIKNAIKNYLERYRIAGHDVEVDQPKAVPLEVSLVVNVNCNYERSQVHNALLRVFSDEDLPDGTRGLLHPDNFSFGQRVYLSMFYSGAQEISGVDSVVVKRFQRQDDPGEDGIDDGYLTMGRYEIPRLRNDKNYPGQGTLEFELIGGR